MNDTAGTAPVLASDRVNEVLARDEALIDVFVRHSAHFAKLRNHALRRVMGRLVTVQDAARLASVPVESLVRDLNAALGVAASAIVPDVAVTSTTVPSADKAAQRPADAPVVELDVREDLRAGREPMTRIMAAVGALPEGAVLHLRAIFEPVPLLALLAKRGFASQSVAHDSDDWSVWFWRDGSRGSPAPSPAAEARTAARADAPASFAGLDEGTTVWLDVRGLHPPEPLMRTLGALESLPPGHSLVHVNDRVPQLLLPMLAERGFACELDESLADRVLLRIWHLA